MYLGVEWVHFSRFFLKQSSKKVPLPPQTEFENQAKREGGTPLINHLLSRGGTALCRAVPCAGVPAPPPTLRALLPLRAPAHGGHGTAPLANALQASAAAAARSSSARINAQNPATPPRGLVGVLNRVHAHRLRTTKARTATVRQPFWPGPSYTSGKPTCRQ